MIKIAIEMTEASNLTKEPAVRIILFESDEDPLLQDTPWWMVRDIIEYPIDDFVSLKEQVDALIISKHKGKECESVTLAADGSHRFMEE